MSVAILMFGHGADRNVSVVEKDCETRQDLWGPILRAQLSGYRR